MKDFVLSLFVLAGSAIYMRAALALPKLQIGDPLGPQVFPTFVALGLAVSGAMLMVQTWRGRTANHAPEEIAEKRPVHEYALLVGIAVWTGLYYTAFEPVGYPISTVVYLFGLLCVFQYGRWLLNLFYACVFTLIAYLVFGEFLHVVLPLGPFSS
jgi:putative tricarboxylic transport membrane protein